MINQLIDDLRHDAHTRSHFTMDMYVSNCGTHGCIAGHVVMRYFDYKIPSVKGIKDSRLVERATELLGLNKVVANHLFHPNCWAYALQGDTFDTCYKPFWTSNSGASMETIAEMKAWAEEVLKGNFHSVYPMIGPDQAANTLQGLIDCPGYVNWQKAIEVA